MKQFAKFFCKKNTQNHLLIKKYFLFSILIIVKSAVGCNCTTSTIKQNYDRSSIIFYGKYIQNLDAKDVFSILGKPLEVDNFKVLKFFKGVPSYFSDECKEKDFIISLMSSCKKRKPGFQSDCKFCFDTSNYYLVYCNRNLISGQLVPLDCGRTNKIVKNNFLIVDENDIEKGKDEAQELIRIANSDSTNQSFLFYNDIINSNYQIQQNQINNYFEQLRLYKYGLYASLCLIVILTLIIIKLTNKDI